MKKNIFKTVFIIIILFLFIHSGYSQQIKGKMRGVDVLFDSPEQAVEFFNNELTNINNKLKDPNLSNQQRQDLLDQMNNVSGAIEGFKGLVNNIPANGTNNQAESNGSQTNGQEKEKRDPDKAEVGTPGSLGAGVDNILNGNTGTQGDVGSKVSTPEDAVNQIKNGITDLPNNLIDSIKAGGDKVPPEVSDFLNNLKNNPQNLNPQELQQKYQDLKNQLKGATPQEAAGIMNDFINQNTPKPQEADTGTGGSGGSGGDGEEEATNPTGQTEQPATNEQTPGKPEQPGDNNQNQSGNGNNNQGNNGQEGDIYTKELPLKIYHKWD
mgnify:CR=1 FL=1